MFSSLKIVRIKLVAFWCKSIINMPYLYTVCKTNVFTYLYIKNINLIIYYLCQLNMYSFLKN